MYYEEKVINGLLYYKTTPNGQWIQMSPERLTEMLLEARKERMVFQEKVKGLESAVATYLEHS